MIISGNRQEAIDMLKLAAEKGIHPWIEVLPSMSFVSSFDFSLTAYKYTTVREAGDAVTSVKEDKVRYRRVLRWVHVMEYC